MKRIELTITDCLTTEESIVIHGTQPNSSEEVEVVIPLKQVSAIIGALPEEPKTSKKGGK